MRYFVVMVLMGLSWVVRAEFSLPMFNGAALEISGATNEAPVLSVTSTNGQTVHFPLQPSEVMSPELALHFPLIKTWSGVCAEIPAVTVRCDQSPFGIFAQIWTPVGTLYVDQPSPPVDARRVPNAVLDTSFRCLTELEQNKTNKVEVPESSSLNQLRTFRLAVTAAGEYTEFHGGTVDSAMAAIVTVFNRVNGIYERELGVRLVLVEGTRDLIFTNKDLDPFTSNNPDVTAVQQAQDTFDLILGSANYDVGMLLNTGTYGLAYLGSVCDPQRKGSACMGLPSPQGENFITYVAHEMSHQFGANHSFNSGQGPCGGARNAATAVEPGTGSTLMSYAGLPCANDSLQPLMNDYYHAKSLQEIRSFLASIGCGQITTTSNHLPTVSTTTNVMVPVGTPFRLTASGTDLDGDVLRYCWEQMDIGPAQSLSSPDNGASPLFRSFYPDTNTVRIFPRWSSLLQNVSSLGEKLPATNRLMSFRVTVRDSKNEGATAFADTQVQVISSAGPFRITSHNSGGNHRGQQTVTWDVAGTTNSPLNATQVNILLSTNGGETFSLVLATNTPNDGSEMVQIPTLRTSSLRMMIQPVGHIFFDINDAPFSSIALPNVTSVAITNGQVRLRWTFVNGNTYQVQALQEFSAGWETLTVSTTVHGSEMEALVPLAGLERRFFRIRQP